jgi:hypothetical protein
MKRKEKQVTGKFEYPPIKPKIFCHCVPGRHDQFEEVTHCPLIPWAEKHTVHFNGFYHTGPVTNCCRQVEGYLPRCPLLQYIFDSHNWDELFENILHPPFEPTLNISDIIKLLDWFIQIDAPKPSDFSGPLEQSPYLFFWYKTNACANLLHTSKILPLLSILHNEFETSYHNPAYLKMAEDLERHVDKLQAAASSADKDLHRYREQNFTPRDSNLVMLLLFKVKEAANILRTRLAFIERDILRQIEILPQSNTPINLRNFFIDHCETMTKTRMTTSQKTLKAKRKTLNPPLLAMNENTCGHGKGVALLFNPVFLITHWKAYQEQLGAGVLPSLKTTVKHF